MSNKLKKKSKDLHKTIKKPLRLSQCMIVKNEEENIVKALSWAKKIAFEQIVVDTGSNDRTVEIAKEMGAKVYYFEWINDFAAAKNYAIEQASGDLIAFLDADEYMTEKDVDLLYNILIKRSANGESMPDIIRTSLTNIEDNGAVISKILQDRIFRNVKELRYHGSIHENISFDDGRVTNILILDQINILHTGYKQSLKVKKGERNIALLKEILLQNPTDYKIKSYLADSLSLKGEYEEAYELYYDCIQNSDNNIGFNRNYNTFRGIFHMISSDKKVIHREITEVLELYERFKKQFLNTPDPDYYLGIYYYNNESYENSIEHMKKAMEKLEGYHQNPLFTCTCTLSGIQCYLGYSYFNLNRYHEALPCLIKYQKEDKSNTDCLIKILHIIRSENLSEEELTDFMLKILQALYEPGNLKDTLLCIKVAKLLGLTQLSEILKSSLNEEDRKWLET